MPNWSATILIVYNTETGPDSGSTSTKASSASAVVAVAFTGSDVDRCWFSKLYPGRSQRKTIRLNDNHSVQYPNHYVARFVQAMQCNAVQCNQ